MFMYHLILEISKGPRFLEFFFFLKYTCIAKDVPVDWANGYLVGEMEAAMFETSLKREKETTV